MAMDHHDQDSEHELEFSAAEEHIYDIYNTGTPVVRFLIEELFATETQPKSPLAEQTWRNTEAYRYTFGAF